MITWNRHVSDGQVDLAYALKIAIYDYRRVFHREPKSITIPFWRSSEMPPGFLDACCEHDADIRFRGVPLLLSITSDLIELRS